MAAVVGALALELAVLQRDTEIGRNPAVGQAVDGAQVELMAFLVAVVGAAVDDIAVGVDRLFPAHGVIAVAGAVETAAEIAALAGGVIGEVQRPGAALGAVFETQIHVVGESDIVVLIEEPALRHAIGAGTEGHAVDTDLDFAGVGEAVAEPGGMREVVARAAVGRIPAVFQTSDDVLVVQRQVEAEGVEFDVAAVSAAIRAVVEALIAADDGIGAQCAADGYGADAEGVVRCGGRRRRALGRDGRRITVGGGGDCVRRHLGRRTRVGARGLQCPLGLGQFAAQFRDAPFEFGDIRACQRDGCLGKSGQADDAQPGGQAAPLGARRLDCHERNFLSIARSHDAGA